MPTTHAIVGREPELQQLREVIASAARPIVAFVEGEAGVGKTALLETILREASAAGALVLLDSARDHAETGRRQAEELGDLAFATRCSHVHGFVALSLGDSDGAVRHLGPLRECEQRLGLGEPAAFCIGPDLAEARCRWGRRWRCSRSSARRCGRSGRGRRSRASAGGARVTATI